VSSDSRKELTKPSPLAQLLPIRYLDQRDLVLATQCHDQLLVCLLFASLVEDAHVGLAAVERFACFTEAARETVVDESDLEDALQGIKDGHASRLAGAVIGRNFDILGRGNLLVGSGGWLFSVRLGRLLVGVGVAFIEFVDEGACATWRWSRATSPESSPSLLLRPMLLKLMLSGMPYHCECFFDACSVCRISSKSAMTAMSFGDRGAKCRLHSMYSAARIEKCG